MQETARNMSYDSHGRNSTLSRSGRASGWTHNRCKSSYTAYPYL